MEQSPLVGGSIPIFQMLKDQDCSSVYDVTKVTLNDISSMIKSAIDSRQDNMNIVKNLFSEETRLDDWLKLLE